MNQTFVKERPILMSGPNIRPLLEDRKTHTRRIIKPQPPTQEQFPHFAIGLCRSVADDVKMYSQNQYERLPKHPTDWDLVGSVGVFRQAGFPMRYRCHYGQPGDRLWVRETWLHQEGGPVYDAAGGVMDCFDDEIIYRADKPNRKTVKWKPSIFMPRWASRILLEITDIRVERLQDISEEDAKAEGVDQQFRTVIPMNGKPNGCKKPYSMPLSYKAGYANLWDKINETKGLGWDANPFVWVIAFRRLS